MKKRHIKDYVPTENGDYQYQGKYYLSRLSEEERKQEGKRQFYYGISCLLLLILALCIPCEGNRTIYVVIPMELTLICQWYYLTGSVALLKAESRMEQKDYDKAYQTPIQALTIAVFLYICSVGGQVIGIIWGGTETGKGDIYFLMVQILILVVSCVIWNRQRKIMKFVTEEKI